MPLKPGQKKDLKIKITKLKGLEQLERKLKDEMSVFGNLKIGQGLVGTLAKDFRELAKKVDAQILSTQQEIAKLKASAPKTPPALDNLVKAIAKECSQVLPYYRKTQEILLRGIDSGPTAFVGRSWNNRRTKDSDKQLQALYDMVLKKHGFKALRSNSIFTTSDAEFAGRYGVLYYIFPKNGFKYHWSKEEKDLVLDDPSMIFQEGLILDLMDDASEWYEKKTGKNIDFDLYEIYGDPQGFINDLKRIKFPKAAKLTVESLVDFKYIKKRIGPTQTNFAQGLESGNEMVISGEYYAIQAESEIAEHVLSALDLHSISYLYG